MWSQFPAEWSPHALPLHLWCAFIVCVLRFPAVVRPIRWSGCRGKVFRGWTATATEIITFTSRYESPSEMLHTQGGAMDPSVYILDLYLCISELCFCSAAGSWPVGSALCCWVTLRRRRTCREPSTASTLQQVRVNSAFLHGDVSPALCVWGGGTQTDRTSLCARRSRDAISCSVSSWADPAHVCVCLCPGGGSGAPGSGAKGTSSEEGQQEKKKEEEEEGGFFSKLKKMFSWHSAAGGSFKHFTPSSIDSLIYL